MSTLKRFTLRQNQFCQVNWLLAFQNFCIIIALFPLTQFVQWSFYLGICNCLLTVIGNAIDLSFQHYFCSKICLLAQLFKQFDDIQTIDKDWIHSQVIFQFICTAREHLSQIYSMLSLYLLLFTHIGRCACHHFPWTHCHRLKFVEAKWIILVVILTLCIVSG